MDTTNLDGVVERSKQVELEFATNFDSRLENLFKIIPGEDQRSHRQPAYSNNNNLANDVNKSLD